MKYLKELEGIAESGVTQVCMRLWGRCMCGGGVEACRERDDAPTANDEEKDSPPPSQKVTLALAIAAHPFAPGAGRPFPVAQLQADTLLSLYNGEWGHSVDGIYSPEFTY